jgi:hypothetical protein
MKKLMILALPILMLASCGKYEDGPAISLRTKDQRLCNEWQVSSAMQNGVDKTSDFNAAFAGYLLDIRKDETYTLSYSPFSLGQVNDAGRWEWMSDKMEVRFTNGDNESTQYHILRLKEKELWVRFNDDNGDEWEVHLVPKN